MIEFLQDFRGKITREHYYTKGAIVTLDPAIEAAVVKDGRAKFVGEVLQDSTLDDSASNDVAPVVAALPVDTGETKRAAVAAKPKKRGRPKAKK